MNSPVSKLKPTCVRWTGANGVPISTFLFGFEKTSAVAPSQKQRSGGGGGQHTLRPLRKTETKEEGPSQRDVPKKLPMPLAGLPLSRFSFSFLDDDGADTMPELGPGGDVTLVENSFDPR